MLTRLRPHTRSSLITLTSVPERKDNPRPGPASNGPLFALVPLLDLLQNDIVCCHFRVLAKMMHSGCPELRPEESPWAFCRTLQIQLQLTKRPGKQQRNHPLASEHHQAWCFFVFRESLAAESAGSGYCSSLFMQWLLQTTPALPFAASSAPRTIVARPCDGDHSMCRDAAP